MKKFNRIILYGLGNGRDHANHIELAKCRNIEFCSLITNKNALMENMIMFIISNQLMKQ